MSARVHCILEAVSSSLDQVIHECFLGMRVGIEENRREHPLGKTSPDGIVLFFPQTKTRKYVQGIKGYASFIVKNFVLY